MLIPILGFKAGVVHRAFHWVIPELIRMAKRREADFYIAHNLAALPAAAYAAKFHNAKLGFDAEDYHSGELLLSPDTKLVLSMTRWIEKEYMPCCDHRTAASEGIAKAYQHSLGIVLPSTILNVFPLSDMSTPISAEDLQKERIPNTISLYWFSQSIGAERGLEDVVEALPHLNANIHLSLRGTWRPGYNDHLKLLCERLGVQERVHVLQPVDPGELVRRAAEHDIGLALEPGRTPNSQVLCSNKIFTYILGGIPVVATSTSGQRNFFNQIPEAIRLYTPGSTEELVSAISSLTDGKSIIGTAKDAAKAAGQIRYNWDVEQHKFLELVAECLSRQ